MTDEVDLAGQVIAGRYDVLELLGTGGMGAVYRVRDRELDEQVALKVIRGDLAGEAAMVERFRHEVKLARRVTHVNVARTFELGSAGGIMYCTMELIDGEALTRRLAQRRRLPVGEAVAIACGLCDGLTAAHAAGVIHRDIKPDNVLIASDGRVVLADFGVASIGVAEGELSGTPAYMAPEQARGEPPTPAADVYAVGLLLAEMVTGHRAFTGEVAKILADKQAIARVLPSDAPADLAEVIGRATARDRADRIGSAAALRRALAPWSRPERAATQPQRFPAPAPGLRTVVVLAPRAVADEPRVYLADAVHEEVLARLGRMPRLRVLPRVGEAHEPGAVVVALEVGEALGVTITSATGATIELRIELAIERVSAAADAVATAVATVLGLDEPIAAPTAELEACDLVLRARQLAQSDFARTAEALALLQQARELAPAHPKVLANIAIAHVRLVFFVADADPSLVEDARRSVAAALISGPELVESHLAAGHVELNLGDPVAAASHFRAAIARAPYSPDAHEQLGRMLLEAGFLEAALCRLEEAIAIAPNLRSARWEIARAWALEGRFEQLDALIRDMIERKIDRPISRARFAWWRRDRAEATAVREIVAKNPRVFVPGLIDALFATYLDGVWAERKEQLVAAARAPQRNRRRAAFIGQLVAEAASEAGDLDTACAMIDHSADSGLFDLHWLDRCPLLDGVRTRPEFPSLRLRIKARADAIYDALYGDHELAVSETAIASSF